MPLRLRIRASKTNQERQGATVAIAPGGSTCPIAALNEWLAGAGYRSRAGFVASAEGRPRRRCSSVRPGGSGDRQNLYQAHRTRPEIVQQTQLEGGFFDLCRATRGIDIQDDGYLEAPHAESLAGYIRDCELFRDQAGAKLL
jgi:hypothetical protein